MGWNEMFVRRRPRALLLSTLGIAIVCVTVSCVTDGAALARADVAKGFNGYVALGGAMVPDYAGSEDYEPAPFVGVKLAYDEFYVEARGTALRVNLMPLGVLGFGLELGPTLGYRFGRDDVENAQVDALREIEGSFAGGAFIKVYAVGVLQKEDKLGFDVETLSGGDGTTIRFGPTYGFTATETWRFGFGISATYADEDYNRTYFSVDADNAARSGLARYEAQGSIQDVSLSASATYRVTPSVGIMANAKLTQLTGDAADSPIVKNDVQVFGGLSISCAF